MSQLEIDIPHSSSANTGAFGAQAKRDAEKAEQEKQKASERKDGKSERRASSHSKHSRSPVKDRDRKSRCENCQTDFSPCITDEAAGLAWECFKVQKIKRCRDCVKRCAPDCRRSPRRRSPSPAPRKRRSSHGRSRSACFMPGALTCLHLLTFSCSGYSVIHPMLSTAVLH